MNLRKAGVGKRLGMSFAVLVVLIVVAAGAGGDWPRRTTYASVWTSSAWSRTTCSWPGTTPPTSPAGRASWSPTRPPTAPRSRSVPTARTRGRAGGQEGALRAPGQRPRGVHDAGGARRLRGAPARVGRLLRLGREDHGLAAAEHARGTHARPRQHQRRGTRPPPGPRPWTRPRSRRSRSMGGWPT